VTGWLRCAILSPVTLVLGRDPEPLTVLVSPGMDFATTLRAELRGVEAPWPDGTVLELVITHKAVERRWMFTITGAVARLVIPAAELAWVRSKDTGGRAALWLDYEGDGTGAFLWAAGPVVVRG